MAEWKKLVVSGSAISQLNNDAGYISASQVPAAEDSFATASFDGTDILAGSVGGTLNFASGSGQGLTIAATAGSNLLTFGLDAIPNSSLANDSITIGSTAIALGETKTIIAGLDSITSTTFVGDLTGNADTATTADAVANELTAGNGIADFTFDGSDAASVVVELEGTTLKVGTSGLAVNELGIDTAQLAAGAVTFAKLDSADVIDSVEGLDGNSSDSTLATSQAIVDYVDAQVGDATLNIATTDGGGSNISIDLNDNTLSFTGADGLEFNLVGTDVGIGITDGGINAVKLNSDVAGDGLTSTSGVLSLTNNSITFGSDIVSLGDTVSQMSLTGFTGSLSSTSVLADGVTATTQPADDSSTKVATTEFVSDAIDSLSSTLTIDSDTGGPSTVDLKSQTLDIAGGTNINTVVGAQTITVNLDDSITVTNATVTGDLVVQGTASFQNEANLLVQDRFILLASGSNSPGDGGIIVQQATQDVGDVFGFDGTDGSGTKRWGIGQTQTASSSEFSPEAFMAAVLTGDATSDTAIKALVDDRYNAKGNIFIADDQDIWIFS
jgi:hypothetical protein